MTKKERCLSSKSIGYYSGFGGLEIKDIEYGINDYVYFITNAWYPSKGIKYHKAKIYYGENDYFNYGNYKINFSDCIKM